MSIRFLSFTLSCERNSGNQQNKNPQKDFYIMKIFHKICTVINSFAKIL